MALIFLGQSMCSLCDAVLREGDDIVMTTAFLGSDHPLSRHSDAGMHRRCFRAWEHRVEFVSEYNRVVGAHVSGDGTMQRMQGDGSIHVTVVDPEKAASARELVAQLERDREIHALRRAKAEAAWSGKSRACPRCDTTFVSVQDRGVCPACRHVFHASELGDVWLLSAGNRVG